MTLLRRKHNHLYDTDLFTRLLSEYFHDYQVFSQIFGCIDRYSGEKLWVFSL